MKIKMSRRRNIYNSSRSMDRGTWLQEDGQGIKLSLIDAPIFGVVWAQAYMHNKPVGEEEGSLINQPLLSGGDP